MQIAHLRVFLAVAEEGGFAAAGRKLHLGRATISERIAELERQLGCAVFTRSPVGLTEAGLVLQPYARRVVRDVDDAVEAVRSFPETKNPRLTIGLMAGGAAELNGPLFTALARALPPSKIELVDLQLADTETAVIEGRVDVAILRSPVTTSALISQQLFLSGRVVVMSERSELAFSKVVRVADLDGLAVTGVHPRHSAEFIDFFSLTPERNGERPARLIPARTMGASMWNILVRGAIATPSDEVTRILPMSGVRAVPLIDAAPSGPVAVSRSGDRRRSVQIFMEIAAHVAATCQDLVPGALPLPAS